MPREFSSAWQRLAARAVRLSMPRCRKTRTKGKAMRKPVIRTAYIHVICRVCGWEDAFPFGASFEAERAADRHLKGHTLQEVDDERRWALRR